MGLTDHLKNARLAAGLSQGELARRIGVARPSVSQVESGMHHPSLQTAEAWAEVCGSRVVIVDPQSEALLAAFGGLDAEQRALAIRVVAGLPLLSQTVRDMLGLMLTQAEAEEAKRRTG